MKKIIVLLLAIIGLVTFEAEALRRPVRYVAVYVEGSSDLDDTDRTVISSTFVTALSLSDDYQPIERTEEFERASQKEGDYQLENVREKEIAKLAGDKFGADYLALITVQEKRREMFIGAKLIDIETGSIIRSCTEIGYPQSLQELRDLAREAAKKLLGLSSGQSTSSTPTNQNNSSQKYGIYDTEVIYKNYRMYKDFDRLVAEKGEMLNQKYAKRVNEYNLMAAQAYQYGTYSADEIIEAYQNLLNYKKELETEGQNYNNQLFETMKNNIASCLMNIRDSQNMIICDKEDIPEGITGTDITQLVIDKLNREYKAF